MLLPWRACGGEAAAPDLLEQPDAKKDMDEFTLDAPAQKQEKPRPDVVVERLWPDKLAYRYQAPVSVDLSLKNLRDAKQDVKLKVELFHGLEAPQTLLEKKIGLAPGELHKVPCNYTTASKEQGAEYGYELRATATDDKGREAVAREYFMVSDNPLKIGHLTIPFGQLAPEHPNASYKSTVPEILAMAGMRAMYFCMAEAPFWAPSDWNELTTDRDIWFSGQAARYVSQTGIKANVKGVHDLGGWMLFYAAKWACGASGFEFARKHPDWFSWDYDWYGCKFDIAELEWKAGSPHVDGKWVKTGGEGTLPAILPLIGKPEVADYGIRQIADSVRQFDWDGIRLDSAGWYVEADVCDLSGQRALPPGTDTGRLEAELVRKIVAAGRAVKPNFVYGNNVGWCTDISKANPKWLAEAASGGLLMDEGMNGRLMNTEGRKSQPWSEVREYLRDAIPCACKAGGYPYGIVPIEGGGTPEKPAPPPPDGCILLGALMASGMHLCYGVPAAYRPYMQLYARHCDLLYGDGMQFIGDPAPLIKVASANPVWWQEYVRRRDLPNGRTQFIIHLINPSKGERYDAKRNAAPLPQKGIKVELTPPSGSKIDRAFRITADNLDGPDILELQPISEGDKIAVTVPELLYWDIVVLEGGVK